jgi:hypothetical protein
MPEQALMTATDFAQAIKAKYPDYASVPDAELASRMLEKYPEYRDRVQSADFASTNAKDASGAAVVDPNSVGTFASHAWEQINPLNAVRSISSAILHPVNTGKAIGAAQGAVFDKAKASYEQGDYLTAARHFVDYLIPLVGPAIDRSSDLFQAGKWAAGGGDALGIGLSIFGPKALGEWKASAGAKGAPPPRAPLTAAEEASNRFAAERGVPLDAATATGSRTMRAAEKRVANSMGGEGTADALISSQQQNLGRVGSDLADATHPMPVTTEQAGEGIRSSMTDLLKALNQKANTSYGKLREIEGRPENAKQVPDASRTAPVKARQSLVEMGPGFEETAAATQSMPMAVDLRDVKASVQPLYNRLKREGEMAPLMGGKAEALRALDRLVNGPDHAPLSIADAALSDLKTMARAEVPELRTPGQGSVAFAVKHLDEAVRMTAAAAGDDAYEALMTGRAATKEKFVAGDVLEQLRGEPVQVFRQMTAPKDTGIGLLRNVKTHAPAELPKVARAYLEDALDSATERGRFDHADRLYSNWQKLGPETKAILFGADLTKELDSFFLLAKRVAENPNPSGTAHTLTALNFGSQPVMWGLSKLLYTPRGVRVLTRMLDLDLKASAGKVGNAAKQAAWIDLANAARAAGVPMELPKAADQRGTR